MLGTGIILEGNLICVDCVKSGKKRTKATIPANVLWGTAGGTAAILGVCAIFLPGQVLMVTLLMSVGALLVGAIGFTLSSVARLATIAVALCAGMGSVYGLIAIRERAQNRAAEAEIASEAQRIEDDLQHDAVMEATRQLTTLDERAQKPGSDLAAPVAQKRIAELHGRIDEWMKTNFGELSNEERTLLFGLYRQCGSLTSNSARRFRAIKLTDKALHVTVAVSTQDPGRSGPPAQDPIGEQGLPVAQTCSRLVRELESLELRLVSATPGSNDVKDLMTINLDSDAIAGLRNNDTAAYMQALPSYSGPRTSKGANRQIPTLVPSTDGRNGSLPEAPSFGPPSNLGPPSGTLKSNNGTEAPAQRK